MGGGLAVGCDVGTRAAGEEVVDWVFPARLNDGPGMLTRQKCRIPVFGTIRSEAPMIREHHERGKVLVQ